MASKLVKVENIEVTKIPFDKVQGINVRYHREDRTLIDVEGEPQLLTTLKTELEKMGAKITVMNDIPSFTSSEEPPQASAEDIAEAQLQNQTRANVRQQEVDRINSLLQAEYTKLGGTGTAPQITRLSELR